jgi:hypothetical protein
MRAIALVIAVFMLAGCRTTIAPVKKQQEEDVYVTRGGCNVRRYEEPTDVPEGSKNLGWVEVPVGETPDATYEALDQLICGKGGDALSSLYWEKSSTETTAQRTALRAIAWQLP